MEPQDRSILCCPQVSCEPRTWHGWAQEGQLHGKPKSQAWEEVQAAAKTPKTPCAGVGAEQGPGRRSRLLSRRHLEQAWETVLKVTG